MAKREISLECTNKRGENAMWKLMFPSEKSCTKWASKLKKAVRPVWENPKVNRCHVCDKNFQLFRRQHHCRKCGRVICADHYRILPDLPELGYNDKVKVCTNCINRVGNIDGLQRAKSLSERETERQSVLKYNSALMSGNSGMME